MGRVKVEVNAGVRASPKVNGSQRTYALLLIFSAFVH